MDDQDAVIASLRKAVAALPDDVALKLHLAERLVAGGYRDEAIGHLGAILEADPRNAAALNLLIRQQAAAKPAAPDKPRASGLRLGRGGGRTARRAAADVRRARWRDA